MFGRGRGRHCGLAEATTWKALPQQTGPRRETRGCEVMGVEGVKTSLPSAKLLRRLGNALLMDNTEIVKRARKPHTPRKSPNLISQPRDTVTTNTEIKSLCF